MKLAAFFTTIAPFLHGRTDHSQAAAALYPGALDSADARRLAIYGRFCQGHRLSVLDKVYAATRAAVVRRLGEAGWEGLAARYYARHPMHHWELNENGQHLPAFLHEAADVPPWLWELADAEWWEWLTLVAPDAAADADDSGPLRLASTVELRPYTHAVLDVLEAGEAQEEDEEQEEPEERDQLVLFYRDRALRLQRLEPPPLTLLVLKAVSEGMDLAELAGQVGVAAQALGDHARELHDSGVLRGRLPTTG